MRGSISSTHKYSSWPRFSIVEGIVPVRRLPNKLLEHRRVRFESVRKNREALTEREGGVVG